MISVLILACNKAAFTQRCLNALLHSTLRPFQLVLVDNGSTDETPQLFATFKPRAEAAGIEVELLRFETNIGAIAGRNRGMEKMRGTHWVFLDNDALVRSRNWLEKLHEVFEQHPNTGIVAPKLVYAAPPHLIQCAGCAVTPGGQVVFRGRGDARLTPSWNQPHECQALISACWMMSATAAKQIGPLDDRFHPVQFEDIDYCYRMREAGFTCRYEPGVEMYHFENTTTGTLNYSYLTVKNGLKFKEKWRARFSQENGPSDQDWKWADVPPVKFEETPENLELLD